MFNSDLLFSHNYGCARPKPADLLTVPATKLFTFADKLDGLTFQRLDVGPNDDPLILLNNSRPLPKISPGLYPDKAAVDQFEEVMHFNIELSFSISAKYKIVHFYDGKFTEVVLEQKGRLGYPVQPLRENYLLCGSKLTRTSSEGYNAVVVDRDGVVLRRLNLGFGLEGMQTTRNGNIWTYYGDEGVFSKDTVSGKIIACFDSDGKHQYPDSFNETFEYWCTAVNVESDNSVWFAPSQGSLVQVENFSVKTITTKQLGGSGAFAIHEQHAFWAPSYPDIMEVDFFVASNLKTGKNKFYQAVDVDGKRLDHAHYAARGSRMYFTVNHDVYVIDMKDIQF